jgi:hypothetical protein
VIIWQWKEKRMGAEAGSALADDWKGGENLQSETLVTIASTMASSFQEATVGVAL